MRGVRLVHALAPLACAAALLLSGCGASPGSAGGDAARAAATPSPPPAELRAGDVVIRAGAVATAGLHEAIATRYGADRARGTVLVTVSVVRTAADGRETALPARVRATRVDLLGRRSDIPLRTLGAPGRVEHAGTTTAEIPDTLRFEIAVQREGATPTTLRFHRDFLE